MELSSSTSLQARKNGQRWKGPACIYPHVLSNAVDDLLKRCSMLATSPTEWVYRYVKLQARRVFGPTYFDTLAHSYNDIRGPPSSGVLSTSKCGGQSRSSLRGRRSCPSTNYSAACSEGLIGLSLCFANLPYP
ncbi:hypothetical protein TRAPUB_238 [Trametes pubescens]|uniref:Uncharacterized protein n=1 Tax=Trametes pubescens TaxID=154538 RepID=A0A1M2VMS2_TRAPU|nr:hypothetical protein TRAPUB_238 [Trametes pubescens]